MILSRFLSSLLWLSVLGTVRAHADQLDEWVARLPKNTVGLIAVKSVPELMRDWESSSFAKLMEDEEFKKWTAPARKDGVAPWDMAANEEAGVGFIGTFRQFPGAALLAIMADAPDDFERGNFPACFLAEMGDQKAEMEALLSRQSERTLKQNSSYQARTEEIAGVTVHFVALTDAPDAAWKEAYAFVDDTLLIAASREKLTTMITALTQGNAEPSEVMLGHLARHSQISAGATDVLVYLNGEALIQRGIDAAKTAASKGENALPLPPEMIIAALGVEEIQSIALMMDLTAEQSRLDMAILHPERPTGILSLLRGSSGAPSFPAFMPADVLSGSVMRYSMIDLWDKLLAMVNEFGPIAAMATMQISGAEAQVGVKLREDLFGSLEDEYLEVTGGTLETQSQVIGFKVKDRARLSTALEGVKRFVGGGFAAFEESDYLGYPLTTAQAMNAQPGAATLAFCLTDDYLLFSTGSHDLLKTILTRMKEPSGPSLWDGARVQGLLSQLPQGYLGAGVADAGKTMQVVVQALTLVQSQAAERSRKKSKKAKDAQAQASAAAATSWFDASAAPSEAMWKRYFGSSVSGYYAPPTALHYRVLSAPVEAP